MGKITRTITKNRQPLTTVIVSAVKIENNKTVIDVERTTKPLIALIDTGANVSCISRKVVEELKLQPVAKSQFNSASHAKQDTYLYQIVIGISLNEKPIMTQKGIGWVNNWLPVSVIANSLEKVENESFDVILGMEIIMQGHLSISDGLLIFSI